MSWIDVPDPQPRQQRPLSSRAEQVTAAAAVYGAAQLDAMRRMAEYQHRWAEVQHLLTIGWTMPQIEQEFARREIEAVAARSKRGAYFFRVLIPTLFFFVALFMMSLGSGMSENGAEDAGRQTVAQGQGLLVISLIGIAWGFWAARRVVRKAEIRREQGLAQLRA